MSSSTERVTNVVTSKITLGTKLIILPGTGMTSNIQLYLPPSAGPTGSYLMSDGNGNTRWAPPFIANTYPTPVVDTYRALTNQLITIDLISGVTGNTGGADTPSGFASTIAGVTVVNMPRNGTLTSTGGTGRYTYRSFPRYSGIDQLYYTIVDASGFTSLNSALCTINVCSGPTAGYTGATFLYACTGSTSVYLYSDGNETTFFTATFPGLPGGSTGIGSICTNRDDNLIYYTSFGNTLGNLFAYDYANGVDTYIGNLTGSLNFSGLGGFVYNNKYLYYMASGASTTSFYGTIMAPFVPGVTQGILYALNGNIPNPVQNASITWDYQENSLVFCGTGGVLEILNPFAVGRTLGTGNSYTGATNIAIAASFDGMHYAVPIGTTGVYNLDFYTGALTGTFNPISRTDINSMAEWVNVAVNP